LLPLALNSLKNDQIPTNLFEDQDKTAVSRKQDHIALAFSSQVAASSLDPRFSYEPLLSSHQESALKEHDFLGKRFRAPLWVSSMTGGTNLAKTINENLARAAKQFGFGMGLGSCRGLLTDDSFLADFQMRPILGYELPLYANLGIAQLEQLLDNNKTELILRLIDKLQADGLIVHVNPFQEWLQPEGDRFRYAPIQTIERLLETLPQIPLIVKEVGQGMGKESLRQLLQLPLAALDFAASGGTNFALLELLRADLSLKTAYEPLTRIGHSAPQMLEFVNELVEELGDKLVCDQLIISGGIKNFLDGYYLCQKSKLPAVYGQASALLRHARGSYENLELFLQQQIQGLELAHQYLRVLD